MVKIRSSIFNSLKFCTTPECSSRTFQNCHLIPESNQLKYIEEELKAKWINPFPADIIFNDFKIDWRSTEIAHVLTFKGFCNDCDSSIFKEIDKHLELNEENMALLAYRAYGYLYWYDRFEAEVVTQLFAEMGKPLEEMPTVRQKDPRVAKNRKEEIEYEEQSNQVILQSIRDEIQGVKKEFKTQAFILVAKTNILFSCACPLTLDPYLNSVKIDWSTSKEPPKIYVHLLNTVKNGCFIFTWDKKYDEFAIPFVENFKSIPAAEKGMTFLAYASSNNMGLAVKPSTINSIPIEIRNRINKEVKRMSTIGKVSNGFFKKVNEYSLGNYEIIDELNF